MELRIPRLLLLIPILVLIGAGAVFGARAMRPGEDPDLEVARQAVIQIYSARKGETYSALSSDLAERYRLQAERMPEWQRGARVEIYGAAPVWRGEGFVEVAVAGKMTPNKPDAAALPIRVFVRVQNGKAVAVFSSLP
ncbi:hypothetical protein [Thermoflexus sp.]|uniref:hypothetical protein n=1 Tax=Thermoflexus sp. TaxID=1969742 RepID=UPI002ADD35B9|nr:hypothetical protein [Thermoflexus sp.]